MIIRLWKGIEKLADAIDSKFHQLRQPLTVPISKLFILLHMNPSHVTAVRFIMMMAFIPLWIQEHYHFAASLLAIAILLDIIDGDFARILKIDSDLRKFEDVIVDNIVVVILPLALIWHEQISGFLGAYYIFVVTLSWWLSVIRRNIFIKSAWLFRAQASSFLFIFRFAVLPCLIFLYALFSIEVFSQVMIALSIILTLSTINDYYFVIRVKPGNKSKNIVV